jgi:GDPmannose 4,6-dehydratase
LEQRGIVDTVDTTPDLAATPPAPGTTIVAVDPRYFRPTEVETLLGDPTRARTELGWQPRITFEELVREMVQEDLALAQRDALCSREGYKVFSHHE